MVDISTYSSVPTYDKLVESVKIYLNRYDEDTIAMVPFFINAAEKIILRSIRMPSTEKMVSFTLGEIGENDFETPLIPLEPSIPIDDGDDTPEDLIPAVPTRGPDWIPLPSDYIEMKYVWIDGCTLHRVTFDQWQDRKENGEDYDKSFSNVPVWSINAGRMYITCVDEKTTIFMTYYADIPEISGETQSNTLLDLLPDAFLYFAVSEGFRFLMEETKSDYWEGQATKRLAAVKQQVDNAEFSGGPLVISPI